MEHIESQTFEGFLGALASKSPAPGGGAVASAVGALGAALGSMVVAYSVDKKSLAEHRPALQDAAARLATARSLLLRLAQEDAAAFDLLTRLRSLDESDPRRRDEEPGARLAVVAAPVSVLAAAIDLLRLLETLAPITNRYLRSDLAIAALLAEATARAAAWNVRVNLGLVDAGDRRDTLASETDRMVADARDRAALVEAACAGEQ